jgi:hypothetical protein
MRLLDYPGLRGKWPPTAFDAEGAVGCHHCLDTSIEVVVVPAPAESGFRVRISTSCEGKCYLRSLLLDDPIFANVFREFIAKHQGKTIAEIGEVDVTHFG